MAFVNWLDEQLLLIVCPTIIPSLSYSLNRLSTFIFVTFLSSGAVYFMDTRAEQIVYAVLQTATWQYHDREFDIPTDRLLE